MSRCTPSREMSGPWPPSRPAILSISSRKMMPDFSTRSTATRFTWSMSISRCSSSCTRYSKASLTFIFRFLVRWPNKPGKNVLEVDVHLFQALVGDDLEARHVPLAHIDLHRAIVQLALAELLPQLLRVRWWLSLPSWRLLWRLNRGPVLRCAHDVDHLRIRLRLRLLHGSRRVQAAAGRAARSSAFSSALSSTSSSFSSRTMSIAISTRSRIIDSTSRPT